MTKSYFQIASETILALRAESKSSPDQEDQIWRDYAHCYVGTAQTFRTRDELHAEIDRTVEEWKWRFTQAV